jgi:hypothetical protein
MNYKEIMATRKLTKEQMILKIKRDVHHTAEICHELIKEKVDDPNMRFGQLLVNALGKADLFYIEDDDLAKLVREKYEQD